MTEYEVTMSSGEVCYILAADLEDAAWQGLQLSTDRDTTLKDVIPTKRIPRSLRRVNTSVSNAWK